MLRSAQETARRRSVFDDNFGSSTTLVSDHRNRFSLPRATFSPRGATPVTRLFFEIGVPGPCAGHARGRLFAAHKIWRRPRRVFSWQNARD